ncbi:hypothetical protein [Aromatoleum buckelii]|uniref:Uncharacterized protein n=1 Tax=Aromatoleum buckelii TaxID=200254 RepID=A0ABX1N7B1_9RHOO|nr:hypothetical protein [Aromatoleum buckelii]MCK0512784.1 hypothetical protein [Aromatoleum buckelii]
MTSQPLDRKRCLSCKRWGGRRRPGSEPSSVEYDENDDKGPCIEGPWHGSLRGPRNACGQWVMWAELEAAEPAP